MYMERVHYLYFVQLEKWKVFLEKCNYYFFCPNDKVSFCPIIGLKA